MTSKNGSKPATQADIQKLDGRIDEVRTDLKADLQAVENRLNQKIDRVGAVVIRTQGQMQELGQSLRDEMARQTHQLLAAFEASAAKGAAYDQKALTHGAMLQDHEEKLRDYGRSLADHRKRISTLEAKK